MIRLPALFLLLAPAALAASAQLTANRATLVSRNLTLIEPPAASVYRIIDGPHGDLKAFASTRPPLAVTAKLPFELTGRGSLLFWFHTDRPFASGTNAPATNQKLLSLPGALSVLLNADQSSVNLVVQWDGAHDAVFERHIRVILPRLPGPAWHHVAIHWDGAKGLANAFLNGTPYYVVGEPTAPFPIKSTSDLVAHLDRFALADVRVDSEPFTPGALPDIVGRQHFGTLAHLLGAADLPAFSIDERRGALLYESTFANSAATRGWVAEGPLVLAHRDDWLVMKSERPDGPEGHTVYWCPRIFPERFAAEWEFELLEPKGLCIVFFAARGHDGKDLFDPSLPARTGVFRHYTHGAMDAYHVSYFANTPAVPRAVANLRKNHGFFCLSNGPVGVTSGRAGALHRALLVKDGAHIRMSVDGRTIIDYTDDGQRAGPVLTEGRIGLRQMQWTHARYRNFRVHALK